MGDLNDILLVDGTNYPLAIYFNKLFAGLMRAEYSNTQTIIATLELTDSDYWLQVITPSGADRTVELAPSGTGNHVTVIYNASGTYNIDVKDSTGTTTYATLTPGKWNMFVPITGNGWASVLNNVTASDVSISDTASYYDSANVESALQELGWSTMQGVNIGGMQLIWNSATSITVGAGRCFAPNGAVIHATSNITVSGLSLSASTWYHVYVYLNAGTPSAEVVTTAPALWKGTAYQKTGDTSRRYVGSVKTDASGNIYEFLHSVDSGLMLYSGDCDLDASPFRALNGGTATTATAVDMSAVIPVTSRVGYLRLLSTASLICSFGPNTNVTGAVLGVGSSTQTSFLGQFPLTSSQTYYYKFGATPTGGAYIDVYGYVLMR